MKGTYLGWEPRLVRQARPLKRSFFLKFTNLMALNLLSREALLTMVFKSDFVISTSIVMSLSDSKMQWEILQRFCL